MACSQANQKCRLVTTFCSGLLGNCANYGPEKSEPFFISFNMPDKFRLILHLLPQGNGHHHAYLSYHLMTRSSGHTMVYEYFMELKAFIKGLHIYQLLHIYLTQDSY